METILFQPPIGEFLYAMCVWVWGEHVCVYVCVCVCASAQIWGRHQSWKIEVWLGTYV